MKTNTIEKVNILKEYLFNTYPDGKFSANSYAFNEVLGVKGQTNIYLDILVKEGFLIKTKKATRGSKSWYPAEYEIVGCLVNDVVEIKSNIEKAEEIHSKVDVNDFIDENFNNIQMKLYNTGKGYVMPISNIVNALNIDKQTIHQLINKNEELFQDFFVNVTLTNKVGNPISRCLTKDGVIGLLMKISYNRLTPDKKKLILEFQKWAIEKLGQLMSTGEVKISNQEQSNAKINVAHTVGISEEDIEKMFAEIQNIIDNKLKEVKSLIEEKNEHIIFIQNERDMAVEREKQVLAKVSDMVDKRFEIMLKKMA